MVWGIFLCCKKGSNFITIGNRRISDEDPVFVIAEIGNNHQGSIELAKRLVDHAIDGGADCLQLREKSLTDAELLSRATKLATLCRQRDVLLIINDRPDIALLSGAHGVHIGQTDISVAQARKIVSDTMRDIWGFA